MNFENLLVNFVHFVNFGGSSASFARCTRLGGLCETQRRWCADVGTNKECHVGGNCARAAGGGAQGLAQESPPRTSAAAFHFLSLSFSFGRIFVHRRLCFAALAL